MRSKYKRRDKLDNSTILEKKTQILQNKIKNSSVIDIQKIKDKKVENVIFERIKPIYHRYEKINYIKEKNDDKYKKEENINETLKNKANILNNKENQYKHRNLNNNIDKDKNNNQKNKVNDVNSSKLIEFKPRNNHFYKHRKIINDKDINKEITNRNQNNNENHKKNDNDKKDKIENIVNNNIKYIYQKDKPNINTNEINNKINTIKLKHKRNYISSNTDASLFQTIQNINNNEQKKLNKENHNVNSISSFLEIKNRNPNNELQPKKSFKYLVHQASKSRDISNSFHKYYESRQLKSRGQSVDSNTKNETLKSEENLISKLKFRNLNILKAFSLNINDSICSINSNHKEIKYNSLTDRKLENSINNGKIINFKYNLNQVENKNDINNENKNLELGNKEVTQNVINNNIYNTTLNFYKINNIYKSKYLPKSKYLSSNNIMDNDDIIYEDETNINRICNQLSLNNINNKMNENYLNKQGKNEEFNNNTINIIINFENILELEKRMKLILEKINKYQKCQKECLEYIIYFFENKLYNEEVKAFKYNHIKKNFWMFLKSKYYVSFYAMIYYFQKVSTKHQFFSKLYLI